ncbi:hypothetical protein [Ancylobacter sp. SL191]|uniref:hypothetical protein n=1 Tax=Ancylobacter sp. SL191 TaxID=2995166 RepID=UPI0022718888|nr:hypothetical protein [Ancylobacter sp. SL191]WAC26427.1 hypothetical protein OU996_15580 [Ancylobacter sp. SL191]
MARPLRFPFKKLVAFDQDTIDGIEQWRREQSPIPSEADAIRLIVRDWLIGHGLMPLPPEPDEALED